MENEPTRDELLKQLEELRIRLSQVENEWREVITTFSQALEQGSAAVYRRNFDSSIYEYMGKGIEDITGYSADTITPATWDTIVISAENKGELAGLPLEEANRRVREGEVNRWMSDTQLRTKSGEIRWVIDMSTVLHDASGHCYGCLGILFDITNRKQAEQELAQTTEELRLRTKEMQVDLNMAREIQMAFLAKQHTHFPPDVQPEHGVLRFYHRYLPTSTLAGDFFNVFSLSDHEAGVLICDVMGHGTRASMVSAFLHGLIEELMPIATDCSNFIMKLNVGLNAVLSQYYSGIFATAFYLVADVKSGIMRYTKAGHPSPFVLRRSQGVIEQLQCGGKGYDPALGLIRNYNYPVYQCPISDNDVVLFFTDGLYEVENVNEQLFGKGQLLSSLWNRISIHPDHLLDEILEEVHHFSDSDEFKDDVCMVAMHVNQPSA